MCYYLYGGVNEEADPIAWEMASRRSSFVFRRGTKAEVWEAALGAQDFRLTNRPCDCGTPVGMRDAEADELREIARQWQRLRQVPGAQYVWFSKSWATEFIIMEKRAVYLDEIDPREFLANAADNCIYTIELTRRP